METSAPSRPAAPAVVAVVVTRDPGPWFDEALEALRDQTYSNLAVLVIDAASEADPTARVAAAMPSAYVRRLETNDGFGASANEVSDVVDGAAFYCFLHDDAAPDPDAIRTLVSEALRSNAGVVGPKLVRWDDPSRLLQVGVDIDKVGERVERVEIGELDQEQHDRVRDVFVVPGACTLVRADLFDAIGGFDEGIDLLNDDLSLCWRAHIAGARVVMAPDARVRHVEALGDRSDSSLRRTRLMRHRIRTMLSCYSLPHRLRVIPQALLIAIVEVLYSLLVGRRAQAAEVVGAWRWNLARRGEIKDLRAKVASFRQVGDAEIRKLQRRGSGRFIAFVRGQLGRDTDRADIAVARTRQLREIFTSAEYRALLVTSIATGLILLVGSRHLLLTDVPAVGQFPAFDQGPVELLRAYVRGWRDVGLGSETPAPTAFALTGLAGLVLFGAMEALRAVLIFGCLVAGLVGVVRMLRPLGSRNGQAIGLVTYAAVPLPYNAFADANWPALVTYAVTPWITTTLMRAAGWAPFADPDDTTRPVTRAVRLGLLLAAAGAFAPALLFPIALLVAGLVLGSVVSGAARGLAPMLGAVVMAAGVAVALNVPWALEYVLAGSRWEQLVGQRGAGEEYNALHLLRFEVGPVGGSQLAYGLLAAGLLSLLIGRGWRLEWAVRGWSLIIVGVGVAWVGEIGTGPDLPPAEVLLVPALVGLALATGLGVAAFEQDLRAYGFGWRQVVSAASLVLLALGAAPTLLDTANGRWYLPSGGLDTTFDAAFADQTGFRVLWIGDPDVLPVDSYALGDDVAYATSLDGLPTFTDSWSGAPTGATELLTDALDLAVEGETNRVGRILAPMGIRYIVIPTASAPAPLGGIERPAPAAVIDALDDQLDLRRISINPAYIVYVNDIALSTRSLVGATAGNGFFVDVRPEDLAGASPVLPEGNGPTSFSGPVPEAGRILHSVGAAPGWHLRVDGVEMPRAKLFGWADGYELVRSGSGSLTYSTSPLQYAVLVVQVVFWAIALRLGLRRAPRRPRVETTPTAPIVVPEPALAPAVPAMTTPRWADPGGDAPPTEATVHGELAGGEAVDDDPGAPPADEEPVPGRHLREPSEEMVLDEPDPETEQPLDADEPEPADPPDEVEAESTSSGPADPPDEVEAESTSGPTSVFADYEALLDDAPSVAPDDPEDTP